MAKLMLKQLLQHHLIHDFPGGTACHGCIGQIVGDIVSFGLAVPDRGGGRVFHIKKICEQGPAEVGLRDAAVECARLSENARCGQQDPRPGPCIPRTRRHLCVIKFWFLLDLSLPCAWSISCDRHHTTLHYTTPRWCARWTNRS